MIWYDKFVGVCQRTVAGVSVFWLEVVALRLAFTRGR